MKNFSKKIFYSVLAIVIFAAGYFTAKQISNKNLSTAPAPAPKFFEGASSKSGSINELKNRNILEVKNGELIQGAVKKASPGDLIRVYPGSYREIVYIDKENIALQGVIVDGEWPTLEGENKLNDAFLYSANNISIENFKIQNYKGNGIMGQGGNNFVISNNWIINTGVYGIFPQYGQNGLIEHNLLTGIEDAAIYVGMCDNIDVRHNEVYGNVAGIEIENSRHALVEGNLAYNNTGGILAFITPGLPIKTSFDIIIRNNFVSNNNHENFGAPGSIVSFLPPGTGVIVMAADEVIIENNIIYGNDNVGIAIVDHKFLSSVATDPESEPNPDRLVILDNIMFNNGNNPSKEVKALALAQLSSAGPDILHYGGGSGSCIRDKKRYRTFGLDNYSQCEVSSTSNVISYLLDKPVEPYTITPDMKGKMTYFGICSGCHSYNTRLIGPAVNAIQAMYKNNPKGIADYIAHPVHKREDFPEMPPQNHLSEEVRLAVAEFMLKLEK